MDASRTRTRVIDFESSGKCHYYAQARANNSGADNETRPHRAGVRARTSPANPSVPRAGANKSGRIPCGGRRRRDGQPCEALSVPGKRRCKWHGGCSTGPRTSDGKARALANLLRGQPQDDDR